MSGLVADDGHAVGFAVRTEQSPYRGDGRRYDFLPLYLYEGSPLYLRSSRIGLKLDHAGWRFDLFLQRRFEGHPTEDVPVVLEGMARREFGADVGAGVSRKLGAGRATVEVMRDATAVSHGAEIRLGYRHELERGRLRLWPTATLGLRGGTLNNYYYGVEPAEATAERPRYTPGSGAQLELGVQAAYRLTEGWHVIAGLAAIRRPQGVLDSPVVEDRAVELAGMLGVMYDFTPQQPKAWADGRPVILRAFYGDSSDCDVMQIVRLACTSTHTLDPTSVAGFEVGRPVVLRLNDWPVDIAVFAGLLRHKEKGLQGDFWQVNGQIKAYYYGFPWSHIVKTRIAFGGGLSYTREVPIMEQRDQALRGRDTSRLLNYMDPSIDVSLGDLIRVKSLKETYVGLGVSHRSGIFGSSQLLNNVNGGSNYIYTHVETWF
jgi:outer membrane protein